MANYYNKDLYKILNLQFDASLEEIKTSYRKLVRLYHPDISNSIENTEKFKEIQEAYEILSDKEKRQKYDILHGYYRQKIKRDFEQKEKKNKYDTFIKSAQKKAKKDESFSHSINEAIDNLFYGKKTSKKQQPTAINGDDINIDLNITCFEALNGTNRKVNIIHTQPCPNCEGRKFINGTTCKMCNASGEISSQKKINVKIPKGVTTGSKVRIKKEGNKGLNGGKDGDLYLIISVEKNPYIEFDGLNILINLPVTPFEAALGADITIPAYDGKINIKIPSMTSSGQKLKLTGQGIENKSKSKRGDIIVTTIIKFPDKLSEKEIELYNQLKDTASYDIRKDFNNAK